MITRHYTSFVSASGKKFMGNSIDVFVVKKWAIIWRFFESQDLNTSNKTILYKDDNKHNSNNQTSKKVRRKILTRKIWELNNDDHHQKKIEWWWSEFNFKRDPYPVFPLPPPSVRWLQLMTIFSSSSYSTTTTFFFLSVFQGAVLDNDTEGSKNLYYYYY